MRIDELVGARPDRRQLSEHRRAELRQRLVQAIEAERDEHTGSRRGPGRRAAIGVVAAVVLAGAGTAAAAVLGSGRPDAAQVADVLEAASPNAGAHLPGWRPLLHAEHLDCAVVNGGELVVLGDGYASDFPMDGLLTAQLIAEECASGSDATSDLDLDAEDVTVCVRDHPERQGGGTGARAAGSPVVLVDGSPCAAGGSSLRSLGEADLSELNRRRTIEVSMLAVPSDHSCPSVAEATAWAHQQINDHDLDLPLETWDVVLGRLAGEAPSTTTSTPLDEPDVCWRPAIFWDYDAIILMNSLG